MCNDQRVQTTQEMLRLKQSPKDRRKVHYDGLAEIAPPAAKAQASEESRLCVHLYRENQAVEHGSTSESSEIACYCTPTAHSQ